MRYALILLIMACVTGCGVQDDGAWRTTPMTNNPNVMNQRGDSAFPGLNM